MATVSPTGGSFMQNNAMLIHIGVEIVLFGGIFFWFNKKTGALEEQVTILTEKVNKLEDLIIKQGEMITQHENMMREIYSIMNGGAPPRSSPAQQPTRGNPKTTPAQRHTTPPVTTRSNIPKTFRKAEKQVEEINENELDDDLANEIADLDEDPDEEYCDVDGHCGSKKK